MDDMVQKLPFTSLRTMLIDEIHGM